MTVLLCPLCSQPRFNNLESLRLSLINAATQNISCPICNDVLTGLDKLTIHLFSHTLTHTPDKPPQPLTLNTTTTTTTPPAPTSLQPPPHHPPLTTNPSQHSTVNLQDLTLLSSFDDPFTTPSPPPQQPPPNDHTPALSEYMSDLLNKKLPVLNFVFTMDNPDPTSTTPPSPSTSPSPLPPPQDFKCPTCHFSFQNSLILSMHQELVHSKSKSLDPLPSPLPEPSPDHPPTDSPLKPPLNHFLLPHYTCHLCSKAFKMKGSLLVHYRVAHLGAGGQPPFPPPPQALAHDGTTFSCSISTKSFEKEHHLTQHVKTHQGKRWQCPTCNKHFTTKYFLKKHQRLHTGEMPYSCQTCNKTFTFQQSYHKHLLYHSDEKPHNCTQCGRAFKELSTLHNHQRIHSGEKPFACEACGKCFRQRVSYIVHQRIHTGVLPYQCTACNKKFRYKVSQRSHKCSAQPPGVVLRQPGDLIQRILHSRNDLLQPSPTS